MFPLYDSIPPRRFPFLNYFLIGLTVFVFFQQLLAPDLESFVYTYALVPAEINFADISSLIPFITSIFLHGGFMHIISNMWFLKVFGDNVETHVHPLFYIPLYLLSGIVGSLIQYFFEPTSTIPMLGASGAVAGILGYYFAIFPHSRVKTLVFIFFFVTIVEISAAFLLGYWFILQLFSGFGSISEAANQGGVAFWAHVGGFVTGFAIAKLFAKRETPEEILEGEIVHD